MIHFKLFALIIMNIKLCDINVSTITMARIYIIRLIHKAIVSISRSIFIIGVFSLDFHDIFFCFET